MTTLVEGSVDLGPADGSTLAIKVENNDCESGVEECECPNNGRGRYDASMRKGGLGMVGLGRLGAGLGGLKMPETAECLGDGGGELSLNRSVIGSWEINWNGGMTGN